MNVRNDQNPHDYSKSAATCSMIISATSALLISGKDSFFPFGNNNITRLVSTPNPASLDAISFATIKSSFFDLSFSLALANRSHNSAREARPQLASASYPTFYRLPLSEYLPSLRVRSAESLPVSSSCSLRLFFGRKSATAAAMISTSAFTDLIQNALVHLLSGFLFDYMCSNRHR